MKSHPFAWTAAAMFLVGVASAQTGFPDVPQNHWAYEGLARLRADGLLSGYPAGLFNGAHVLTRYEIAVAMAAAYHTLADRDDDLDLRLRRLEESEAHTSDDVSSRVLALESGMAVVQSLARDIAVLRMALASFGAEYRSLGFDTASMRASLAAFEGSRLSQIEGSPLPFKVSVDESLIGIGGYGTGGQFGLTVDGRLTGLSRNATGQPYPVGADKDSSIFQDLDLNVTSTKDGEASPQWGAMVSAGDVVGGSAFGDMSTTPNTGTNMGNIGFREAPTSVVLDEAWLKWVGRPHSKFDSATVGRQGYQISPYFYRRPDPAAPYFSGSRWSNGDWSFDGAKGRLRVGAAYFDLFGGRTSDEQAIGGGQIQPLTAGRVVTAVDQVAVNAGTNFGLSPGAVSVDQEFGARGHVDFRGGRLDAAYVWMSSDNYFNGTTGTLAAPPDNVVPDGVRLYGLDANEIISRVKLSGAYGRTDVFVGGDAYVKGNDDAYWLSIARDWPDVGVKAGYEYIAPLYGAPGDWGRLGTWWNPTDVKGWSVDAWWKTTPVLKLSANGQWLTDSGAQITDSLAALDQMTDRISDYNLMIDWSALPRGDVTLGYEAMEAKGLWGNGAGNGVPSDNAPYEHWWNVGISWRPASTVQWSLLWQTSRANLANGFLGDLIVARGGLISSQLTIHF